MLPAGLQALYDLLKQTDVPSSPLLTMVRSELMALDANALVQHAMHKEGMLSADVAAIGIVGGQIIAGNVGAGGSCNICGRALSATTQTYQSQKGRVSE